MAKFCVRCGKEMDETDRNCRNCGRVAFGTEQPPIYAHKSNSHMKTAVGVVVVLLIAAGIGYWAASNANTAWVTVHVHSTHITQTVEVFAFIDDTQVLHSTNLTPGGTVWTMYYQKVSFPIWDDSKTIVVKAISQGGGLGSQSDMKVVIVQKSHYYTVDLYV